MVIFGIFSLFVFFGSTKELFSDFFGVNLLSLIDLKVIVILIFLFLLVALFSSLNKT